MSIEDLRWLMILLKSIFRQFYNLIVRWFQFGLFCPVMRLHGARLKPKNYVPRHPGVKEISGGDNEIWSFGDRNYPILKGLVELRESLKPYICKYMDITSKTGIPIMSPMFFDYYDDEICYTLEDQYMFGEDILFAPITTRGCGEREVYLPKGNWVSVMDKRIYKGMQKLTVCATLTEFIAFVKEGSEVLSVFDAYRSKITNLS